MSFLTIIAFILLAVGLLLDSLNVLWGFQSAWGRSYKSGVLLIPLFFYAFFVSLVDSEYLFFEWYYVSGVFLVLHFLCYFLVPPFFDFCHNLLTNTKG